MLRKKVRRNPSLRLKTVQQLKDADKWIEDEEQFERRRQLDAVMSLNDALEMETPLTNKQLATAAYYKGSDTFEAADLLYESYFKDLRYKAQHDLAAYHEFINPTEVPAPHHRYICEKLMNLESRKIRLLLLSMPPGSAKALALDTIIPTPEGNKTIEELKVGDEVWHPSGQPTKVVAKSEVFTERQCYKATTSDGHSVVCDKDHLWNVRLDRKRKVWSNRTAEFLFEREEDDKGRIPLLPVAEPVDYGEDTYVPVLDPYTLGAWLGDGTSSDNGLTCHSEDAPEIVGRIISSGITVNKRKSEYGYGIIGIRKHLVSLDVLNNKHVPEEYFRSSIEDRVALLQGLCDTDGTVDKKSGMSVFCGSSLRLVKDVQRLLLELGVKNRISVSEAKIKNVSYGDTYRIHFSFRDSFSLTRKAEYARKIRNKYGRYLSFSKTESVPTQCITVEATDGLFLAGEGYIPTHNSQYASRSFITWYLGRNPHHKILSGGYNTAFVQNEFSKPNRSVMGSDEYQSVFPDVHIDPSFRSAGLWAIEDFGGRYNVRSVGAGTSGIRADLIVLDDIIAGAKTAQSPTELQNSNNWVTGDVLPRRLGNNSIILIIGTRWHSEDTIGFMERMLEENPDMMPYPAEVINISAEGGPDNPLVEEGHWLWEEFYGAKHYVTQKGLMEPGVWSATYLGVPLDQQGFYLEEGEIGRYDELPDPITSKGKYKITMSIDTAQKSTTDSNRTAIAVFAEHIPTKTHYLIDAWAGREPLLILIDRIGKMVKKNSAHSILIEDAAMGSQILENYRQAFTCPLIGFKPQLKGNKQFNLDTFLVPAIQGGKILFPKNKEWVVDVINEIVAFPQALLDDYVDACSQYARRIMKRRKLGMKEMKVGY